MTICESENASAGRFQGKVRRTVACALPKLSIGLTLAAICLVVGSLRAEQPPRILIFPFHVQAGQHEENLRAFADHAHKRLRTAIDLLKDRYTVEPRQVLEKALGGKAAPESDEQARAMADQAGADLALYGFLSEGEGFYRMKAVMWDVRNSRQAISTELKVNNIHGLPEVLELFAAAVGKRLYGGPVPTFYRSGPLSPAATGQPDAMPFRPDLPRNTGPWRSPQIGTELWAIAVGDLDGDGKNEVVLLEDGGVSINRLEEGLLRPLTQFSFAPARFLTAEIADIEGDGIDELIVCSLTRNGIESIVIKYEKREFKIAQRIPNIIVRAIREPGEGDRKVIVGQRTDEQDVFSGEMVRFAFRNDKLIPDGKLMLPAGTLLLSYAAGEIGPHKEFLRVILNQDQRLMVYDRDNRLLYEASDRIYGLEPSARGTLVVGSKAISFPGKIMIADTDAAGENELLVIKQGSGTSAINALSWDGTALVEKWKTIGSRGIISDFTIQDVKNEGVRSLALILVEISQFPALTRPRSVVFAYDLIP